MGPYIVTADEVPDPQALHLETRVNGEIRQDAETADMIFSVAAIISAVSEVITLEPGDIIATGTPDGVGQGLSPPAFLSTGDVVEVSIERIGTLQTTFDFR